MEISTYLTHPLELANGIEFDATVGGVTAGVTLAAGWYAPYFWFDDPSGGVADPWPVADAVVDALDAAGLGTDWVVAMRPDGRRQITNTAATWSIAWSAGTSPAARLLGFAADVPSTAAGTYAVADYAPAGVIASAARVDTGPQPRYRAWAPAYPGLGEAGRASFSTALVGARREVTLRHHPRTQAVAAARGLTTTPLWPRTFQAGGPLYLSGEVGAIGSGFLGGGYDGTRAWTILDAWLYGVPPVPWACAWGNFQDFVSGRVATTLEHAQLCYLDATGAEGLDVRPSYPGGPLRDVGPFAFVFRSYGQDFGYS